MPKQVTIPETTDEIEGPLDAINYVILRTSWREAEINELQAQAPLYVQNANRFHDARRAVAQCRKAALFTGRVVAKALRNNPRISDGDLAAAIMGAAEASADLAVMDRSVTFWVGRLAGILHTRNYEALGNMQIGSLGTAQPITLNTDLSYSETVEVFEKPNPYKS